MSLELGGAPSAVEGTRAYHALKVGDVGGGGQTNPLWLSDVSSDALRTAIETSLRNLGYLASDDARAGYVVTADIVDIDRPAGIKDPVLMLSPINVDVTIRIHYTVTRVGGGKPVFDETLAATGAATADDALTADARLRKANEAAVRGDIQVFLKQLRTAWK